MVLVLDKNKKPLSPCREAKARKLLKQGKAVIHKKYPFTIRLKELKQTESSTSSSQEYKLKIDYGSRCTGLSLLSGNNVLWLAELQHRTDIKSKLDSRREHRRFRRNKLRYRKARFLNRAKTKGWIPPSLQSRVDNIKSWVERLRKLIPLTAISYENCKFDTQLIENAKISGIEYQQGTLMGYTIREYLLEKYDRKCIYCGAQNTPLEIEHLIPKSRGGSDRIDNLGIACIPCNREKGNKTPEEFGYTDIQNALKKSLRDSAIINATRWRIYEALKSTELTSECGSGARTKMNRIKLKLPKTHYYDSVCIGVSTPPSLHFKMDDVAQIKASGRGLYQRTNLDKYGFPRGYLSRQKQYFGFQSGDMAKAVVPKGKNKGTWHGSLSCRKSGSFDISTGKEKRQGINYKYCQLIQKADGYKYFTERREA